MSRCDSWPDWSAGCLCRGHQAVQSVLHVAAAVSAGFHFADGQLIQLTVNSFNMWVCVTTNTQDVLWKGQSTQWALRVTHTHTHTQELVLVPSWWTGGCSTAVSHNIKLNKIYISAVSAADLEEDWCCGCCCRCCRVGSPPQDQNNPGWEQRSLC